MSKWWGKLIPSWNPCIKVRKGSGKVLFDYLITPMSEVEIETKTLAEATHLSKKKEEPVHELKKHKFYKFYLFGKKRR